MERLQYIIQTVVCFLIGAAVKFLGGWDAPVEALFFFITVDFASGWCLAAVFKKSKKTDTGALSSKEAYIGIFKKIMILVMVAVAYELDLLLGTQFIRTAAIFAFCANEVLSITENAGLMLGYDVPDVIRSAIDILIKQSKGEGK